MKSQPHPQTPPFTDPSRFTDEDDPWELSCFFLLIYDRGEHNH